MSGAHYAASKRRCRRQPVSAPLSFFLRAFHHDQPSVPTLYKLVQDPSLISMLVQMFLKPATRWHQEFHRINSVFPKLICWLACAATCDKHQTEQRDARPLLECSHNLRLMRFVGDVERPGLATSCRGRPTWILDIVAGFAGACFSGCLCGFFASYSLRRSASHSFVRVFPIHSIVYVPLMVSPLTLPR
jgi:hypothetical protein